MQRTPCPTCSCNFISHPELFPDLTGAKVQRELWDIKTQNELVSWIARHRIAINWNQWEAVFPRGICKSVQNKIRKKATDLWVISDWNGLFNWVDSLDWNDNDWLSGVPWNPKPGELHLDG